MKKIFLLLLASFSLFCFAQNNPRKIIFQKYDVITNVEEYNKGLHSSIEKLKKISSTINIYFGEGVIDDEKVNKGFDSLKIELSKTKLPKINDYKEFDELYLTEKVNDSIFKIRDILKNNSLNINENNRFVTDTEKTTWNNKSTFSGNYSDLSGKPTIPTALSQLTEDTTHKFITEAEKANIPKNTALFQNFSQAAISIDFTNYDIQEDGNFDANTAITTGNKTITITNPFLNKVVTILLPKITEGTVFIFPDKCYKLTGDMSDTLQNIVMIHCIGTSPARYLYTISQIQA